MIVVAKLCEYVKNYWSIPFKIVNFIHNTPKKRLCKIKSLCSRIFKIDQCKWRFGDEEEMSQNKFFIYITKSRVTQGVINYISEFGHYSYFIWKISNWFKQKREISGFMLVQIILASLWRKCAREATWKQRDHWSVSDTGEVIQGSRLEAYETKRRWCVCGMFWR